MGVARTDHAPGPQSERDELTEDGEGSIRSSEEGPGDSGEWGGTGTDPDTDLGPRLLLLTCLGLSSVRSPR